MALTLNLVACSQFWCHAMTGQIHGANWGNRPRETYVSNVIHNLELVEQSACCFSERF